MSLVSVSKGVLKKASDNLPAILTAVGVAGVISTSVLASKATLLAQKDIWEAKSESTDELDNRQIVLLVWPRYIPSAIAGAVTIAAVISAQGLNARRQALVLGLYTTSERVLSTYKDKVVEVIGEKAEREIREQVVKDEVLKNPPSDKEILIVSGHDSLFLDSPTGRYFTSDMQTVRKAVNDVNEEVNKFNTCSKNDFYRKLGLPPVQFGEDDGWNMENKLEVEYVAAMTPDDRPCVAIMYRDSPVRSHWKGM